MDIFEYSHERTYTSAPATDASAASIGSTPLSHHHTSSPSMLQEQSKHAFLPPNTNGPSSASNQPAACDIKPRLTKDQHDILEAEYQRQNKPNTDTKRTFADRLNVSLDKVNVRQHPQIRSVFACSYQLTPSAAELVSKPPCQGQVGCEEAGRS